MKLNSSTFLKLEFLILFVLLPLSLVLPILIWIKILLVLIGFSYLLIILRKFEGVNFRLKKEISWSSYLKRILVTFFIVIAVTTTYVYLKEPSALFFVPLNNPLLYVAILLIYSLLSVWPQEIIYRTFFFERYSSVFKSTFTLVFVNALIFSLAHLFFKNLLVLILTFIGGVLFGLTYLKFKSTTLVSIEHALYGNWLFTVGMGEMLAFPGMDNGN